jgi:hypothetical protein
MRVVIPHSDWFSGSRDSCSAQRVVSPLFESSGHRPLQAVDIGFQSRVPGDMPLPQLPGFQAYLILNTGRYRRP